MFFEKKTLNDKKEWIPIRKFLQCKEEGENKNKKKYKEKILRLGAACPCIFGKQQSDVCELITNKCFTACGDNLNKN